MKIEYLIQYLRDIGLDLSSEEVADIFWLAGHLTPIQPVKAAPSPELAPLPPLPGQPTGETGPEQPADRQPPPETGPASQEAPQPPKMVLPPEGASEAGQAGMSAAHIATPAPPRLAEKRDLAKSLRLLRQKAPSRGRFEFDELRTVRAIADQRIWQVFARPALDRQIEIDLVVEESPSMLFWGSVVNEFNHLVESTGFFRKVNFWSLRVSPPAYEPELYVRLQQSTQTGLRRRPAELANYSGSRLIVLISDCISPTWHNGKIVPLLETWTAKSFLSLLWLLPEEMKWRTGLRTAFETSLRSSRPIHRNTELLVRPPELWPYSLDRKITSLPTISLEPQALLAWAELAMGISGSWQPGYAFADAARYADLPPEIFPEASEPDQIVDSFRRASSKTAWEMAIYFSVTAPLSLPVMRLIQEAMLPGSKYFHLIEVLLGGILKPLADGDGKHLGVEEIRFEFLPGVRERLGNNLPRSKAFEVLRRTASFVNRSTHQSVTFDALLASPEIASDLEITSEAEAFAVVSADVLRRYGKKYFELADKLEALTPRVQSPPSRTVELSPAQMKIEAPQPSISKPLPQPLATTPPVIVVSRTSEESFQQPAQAIEPLPDNLRLFRPALVIGLGGTGVKVLKSLKAELLSASPELRIPEQVRLLAIDTVQESSGSSTGERSPSLLQTELDAGEFIYLGGNIRNIATEVASGKSPQISSWFRADTYLRNMPQDAFDLSHGASQTRQFGRVAVFYDIGRSGSSGIMMVIGRQFSNILHQAPNLRNLDVHIIASLAGGTGAGMFIDIVTLVQRMAQQERGLSTLLRGYLVLPAAFAGVKAGSQELMNARSAAALREISRFMVAPESQIQYPKAFGQSITRSRGQIHRPLLDYIYLFDGRSQVHPVDRMHPEIGLAPVVADAVTAFIDKPANQSEDGYAFQNANLQAQKERPPSSRNTVSVSSVGTYSLILPVSQIIESLSTRLALEALDILLAPDQREPDGAPIHLSPYSTSGDRSQRGRDRAMRWLQNPASVGFLLLSDMHYIIVRRDSISIGELAARPEKEWIRLIEPLDENSQTAELRRRSGQEFETNLVKAVSVSDRSEPPEMGVRRIIRQVEEYKRDHFGTGYPRNRGVRGSFQHWLDLYASQLTDKFSFLVHSTCQNILNSVDDFDSPARLKHPGKLGYLNDYLAGLDDAVSTYLKVLEGVLASRVQYGEHQDAEQAAVQARTMLEEHPSRLFNWPDTRRQRDYLKAEQRLVDIWRLDIIINTVKMCTESMLEILYEFRNEMQTWTKKLALDPHSVYRKLLSIRRQLDETLRGETNVRSRKILLDEKYEAILYDRYARKAPDKINALVEQWSWFFERLQVDKRVKYELQPSISGNRLRIHDRDYKDLEVILSSARQIFTDIFQQESVLKCLMFVYPSPEKLAQELLLESGPLLQISKEKTGVLTTYFHIPTTESPEESQYIESLARALEINIRPATSRIIQSEDRFKIRYVRTTDLIPIEEVRTYQEGLSEYSKYIEKHAGERPDSLSSPGQLHVFPSEINAVRYEQRLASQLHQRGRILRPEVVSLLEDLDRLGLFTRCLAYGLIHISGLRDAIERGECYLLELSGNGDQSQRFYLTLPSTAPPSFFEAAYTFIITGKDVRPYTETQIHYDAVDVACKKFIQNYRTDAQDSLSIEREYLIKLRDQMAKMAVVTSEGKASAENDLAAVIYLTVDDEINARNRSAFESSFSDEK